MDKLFNYTQFELNLVDDLNKQEKNKILDLVMIFSNQEHSGQTANIVINTFKNFAKNSKNLKEFKKKVHDNELDNPEKDFYDGFTGESLNKLAEKYYKDNILSDYLIDSFCKVAMFKPLTPLTFDNDEWNEIENGVYQNKRNSRIFKDGKNGKPYEI